MHVVIACGTRSAAFAAAIALAACGEPRVTLVPLLPDSACGRPVNANAITVTAFAPGGELTRAVPIDGAVDIADFPADTVQLGVEVVIGGGVVGAAGKTAPLMLGELEDGTAIPIFMGTLDGFCPTGAMIEPRRQPLIARAGDGALIAGGIGELGPLSTAEFYDRATGAFTEVVVPEALRSVEEGLAGVVLTTLPDGRVALTGGVRGLLAVFDPVTRSFGQPVPLVTQRAFHGASAIDDGRVVLSGGCSAVSAGGCAGTTLRSTIISDLQGNQDGGPTLAAGATAIGARLFDTGAGFVLAGGSGAPGEAHRFAIDARDAERIAGLAGQPALLDGGALVVAFAGDGGPPASSAFALAPGGAPVALRDGPELAGARPISLEDGSLLVIGGDPQGITGGIARYVPTRDGWEVGAPIGAPPGTPADAPDQPGSLTSPALALLADGSVLVVGGEPAASARAWLFRPSLVGPASGSITAVPMNPANPAVLTAPDPRAVTRSAAEWVLTAADDTLAARALVGGPRMRRGSITATVRIKAGGLALIAQQVAPERALVARLVPGAAARLERAGGELVCEGAVVPGALPTEAVTARLVVGDRVSATVGEATVVDCAADAADTGAWGVAAAGAGAQIAVATVTVAR